MGTAGAVPVPEDQAGQSFLSRFVGVFLSPGETFDDIVRKPDFLVPLILSIVIAVSATELFLAKIDMTAIIRWAFEHSSRAANLPPDQMEQIIDRTAKFQGIAIHAAGVIWPPLVALVTGLIGMIGLSTVFGAKVSFKTAFSIASYAYLVVIPESLIGTIMVLFGDPQHIISNPQNVAPVTVGFFLDPATTSKPLMSLASSLDIFTFWLMGVLAIGFAAASGRRAKASSMFFVYLGLWIVWTLIKVGLSTLSG
jgi:hypothetical protein